MAKIGKNEKMYWLSWLVDAGAFEAAAEGRRGGGRCGSARIAYARGEGIDLGHASPGQSSSKRLWAGK